MSDRITKLEKTGIALVAIMALLQVFYGLFAYIDPNSFAILRGTPLFSDMDADWINIYGSRTVFITLVLGYLLYSRNYAVLMWCAIFGTIMPITDGILAFKSQAPLGVIAKHAATVVYLMITCYVLRKITIKQQ